MLPNQRVFDSYWHFAAERQRIFFKRLAGEPAPWTDDPILQKYKFCNTYRASDRVSQYLIRNVIYQGSQNQSEVVFRILFFRLFNKIETWQYLEEKFGSVELSNFAFETYANVIQERFDSGHSVFGGAFILCANKAFGFDQKHLNYLSLIKTMMLEDKIENKFSKAKSLQEIFLILRSYPLIGNFMAYQLAIDLNYSEVLNFSENDFTIAGPGAERGIRKCFTSTKGKSKEYIINWMVENQEAEFDRLSLKFQSLWERPLHAIDCQGLFCEIDKYSRVAFPELKSNRKRIKSTLKPNRQRIEYFYPPKWGINNQVEAALAQFAHVTSDDAPDQQLTLKLF
jgi:hypothetical protein